MTAERSKRATAGSEAGSRRLIILVSLLVAVVSSATAAVVVVGWPMWQEHAHWQAVSCGDGESVRRYQQAYPGGRYQNEAETCLADEKKRKDEAALLKENRRFTAVFGREASPDANNADGITDLHYAAAANLPGLVKFLLDAGSSSREAMINKVSNELRAKYGLPSRYRYRYGEVNARMYEDGKPLSEISRKKLRELTNTGHFDVWYRIGATPLHFAASGNAREAAKLLIASGADVNAKDNRGGTPLHSAASVNAREAAELLIASGADINAKENRGGTPLHSAASVNARKAAELLIASGADINAKGADGATPLHIAAWENAREAAELLIAHGHGADVNAKTEGGVTPLHLATEGNARELAELLIVRGADVNAKAKNGWTPLHFAADRNAREASELLLWHGANIHVKNNDGEIPSDLARAKGHSALADWLRSN